MYKERCPRRTNVQVDKCPGGQMSRWTNVQGFKCPRGTTVRRKTVRGTLVRGTKVTPPYNVNVTSTLIYAIP